MLYGIHAKLLTRNVFSCIAYKREYILDLRNAVLVFCTKIILFDQEAVRFTAILIKMNYIFKVMS